MIDRIPRCYDDCPFVFPGRPPTRAIRTIGIRRHGLRHSFASEAVIGGESLPMVGRILGHTTNRNVHLGDATLIQAAQRSAAAIQRKLKTAQWPSTGRSTAS